MENLAAVIQQILSAGRLVYHCSLYNSFLYTCFLQMSRSSLTLESPKTGSSGRFSRLTAGLRVGRALCVPRAFHMVKVRSHQS